MRPPQLPLVLTLLLFAGAGLAQDLASLLRALDDHPALLAAQASLEVAQLNRQGVSAPISFSGNYSYSRLAFEEPEIPLPPEAEPDKNSQQASVSATVRPFLFGDNRDRADQRDLEVLRAELALRETRANLETQAVEAAAGLLLAQAGLELAAAGQALAGAALTVTETRFGLGAATRRELDQAALALARAESQFLDAAGDFALAEASLTVLVGEARLEELPEIEPVQGTTPAVERSRYDLALAELAVRNAERSLIPTVQASYAWNIDDQNALSLSLESRTLQPTLSYQYASGASAGVGSRLVTSFSIGVGVTVGPELFNTLDGFRGQRQAAEGALLAAVDRTVLTELSLQNGLEAARRLLELARANLALETQALADSRTRVALGLAPELEAEQVAFNLMQVELEVLSAELEVLRRTLDSHRSYAIPLSEVLP